LTSLNRILFAALFISQIFIFRGILSAETETFKTADACFLARGDREKAVEALKLYEQIYSSAPSRGDAAWRLSMASYFVGFNLTQDREEKKRLFAQGRDAGLASVKCSSSCVEAHFWTAVNMALYGQTVGVFKMIFTLGSVMQHLEEGIAIDPSYAFGGGQRVLGKIYESLPSILGGSRDKARSYYEKAIENGPDEPLNYLFLSKLLAKNFRDKKAAIAVAEKGLSLKCPEAYRTESIQAYGQLREFYDKELNK
jgi:tetratricopeptide (TPR) repeat protein